METKQKWVKENGVFYPIPGDTTLHITPGNGVFQIYEEKVWVVLVLGFARWLMHSRSTLRFTILALRIQCKR